MTDFYLGIFVGMTSCAMFALILCLCDTLDKEATGSKMETVQFEDQRTKKLTEHLDYRVTYSKLKLKCTKCAHILILKSNDSVFSVPKCTSCRDPFQSWRIV